MTIEFPSGGASESAAVRTPSPAIWTGVYTGALLTVVMIGSLVAANRIPELERYAFERNAASYSLFVILMLIPVCRFLNSPLQMFVSSMIAWVIFLAAYDMAGFYFHNLFMVLRTPFQALIEGAIAYGVSAAALWVISMIAHARRYPILPRRRRTQDVVTHHR
jgi:hypothetical protein